MFLFEKEYTGKKKSEMIELRERGEKKGGGRRKRRRRKRRERGERGEGEGISQWGERGFFTL